MSDIEWPYWERSGQRLLELMPAFRRPSLTRGEVLALADGWASAQRNRDYEDARSEAFWADRTDGRENAVREVAWRWAWDRTRASGEWRNDLLERACLAIRDAAHGRSNAHRIEPAFVATLERVWREVVEDEATRPADLLLAQPTSPPDPDMIASFVERCVSRGWDEAYSRAIASPAYDGNLGPRRLADDATLRHRREATWAGGRDTLAGETARAATAVPLPGGCFPDELMLLAQAFCLDVARTAEAVVARDLIDPDDFAVLTETWRSHFGSLGWCRRDPKPSVTATRFPGPKRR